MEKAKRRLAAVMFTDIVGYSKLMNEDETRAMQLLENYDDIGEKCFNELSGRLIKKIGDADFVEFSSALDAVSCAINLQNKLKEHNSSQKNSFDKIHIRIGIHIGDIIEKGDDIFGDGVNIASRIVSVANEGEICISKEANASIQGQKNIISASIGSHSLKNIVEKWDLYKVFSDQEDYKSWAEANYNKQAMFKEKASQFKRYLYILLFFVILGINIPIIRYNYFEWKKKDSIEEFNGELQTILSSARLLDSLIFLKKYDKDIFLSIKQDFLFTAGRTLLKTELNKDSIKVVKNEIKNVVIPLIEMMNKFDGYIEIASANDSDPLPKKWALGKWKAIPSNEHISGARSASVFKYFVQNGLEINKIKLKNLLWGSYKPYAYINSDTIPTWDKILEANSTRYEKTMNRRFDIHFFYD